MCFGPCKNFLGEKFIIFEKKTHTERQGVCQLSKHEFSTLLGWVWRGGMISKTVIGGFVTPEIFQVDARKFQNLLPVHKNSVSIRRVEYIKCTVHLQAILLTM